ncbi:hypothetical protein [Phenylobacterium sp.]|jgi:hypothetical protein|uniref:hypothetical protein n=1 Tax=Phenylobacterium sp. TaxID=1871053 RepID=UPI002F40FFEB
MLLSVGGCASVYVNDPDLAKQADAADTNVQGGDTVKPFTTQLTNLNGYGARQDLAVAVRDVAMRDALVAPLLGLSDAKGQHDDAKALDALDADACARLQGLVGGDPCKAGKTAAIVPLANELTQAGGRLISTLGIVASTRDAYERYRDPKDTTKDDCDTLTKAAKINPGGITVTQLLANVQTICGQQVDDENRLRTIVGNVGLTSASEIGHAFAATLPTTPAKSAAQGDKDLTDAIAAAKDLAVKGDVAQLNTFQSDVETALKGMSSAAKLGGLNHVQAELANTLTGALCSPPPPSGTDCSGVAKSTTSGRTAAVWSVLQAIAQIRDADDPRYRSANWLAAANAILAAEKSDVSILANAEAQAVASAKARTAALSAEAAALAQVHQYAKGGASCPAASAYACGLAAYLVAWNTGVIPEDILAYREPLIFTRAALQRQQAAQTEQQSLARAASASLKAYADGGVQPSVIAQLLFDAGLLGVAASK